MKSYKASEISRVRIFKDMAVIMKKDKTNDVVNFDDYNTHNHTLFFTKGNDKVVEIVEHDDYLADEVKEYIYV